MTLNSWWKALALFVIGFLLPFEAGAAPMIMIDDPIWNVGIIVDNQGYEKAITLTNSGDEPLVLERIEECCGFYVGLEGSRRLLPGESARLKLTVSTFKLVGDLRAEAFLHSNDPVNPRYSIFALGQVVPKDHVLGELLENSHDLGVVAPGDRLPFSVRVRNAGNVPLKIRKIERPSTIVEITPLSSVAPGEEAELKFEYVPERVGPIEDRLVLSSNDALNRTLTFELKGYVSRSAVSDHALSIQPVGKVVAYDPLSRGFPYRFSINNGGSQEVEILKVESSLPLTGKRFTDRIGPDKTFEGEVMIAPKAGQVPVKGYVYFLLAVPIEVR